MSTPARRIVKKIKRGEYVNFDKLLPPTEDAVPGQAVRGAQKESQGFQAAGLRSPKLARGLEYLPGHPSSDGSQDSVATGKISDHRLPAVLRLPGCIGFEIRPAISGGGG